MRQAALALAYDDDWRSKDLDRLPQRTPGKIKNAEILNFAVALARKRAVENGDQAEAIEKFSEIITADPTDADAWFNRGHSYQKQGDLDHAIADYDRAIACDPNYAPAYSSRGHAYHDKGDLDRAIADYDHAIGVRLQPCRCIQQSRCHLP
jgi:tetratricopeptide (TPR) repeat protein